MELQKLQPAMFLSRSSVGWNPGVLKRYGKATLARYQFGSLRILKHLRVSENGATTPPKIPNRHLMLIAGGIMYPYFADKLIGVD